MTHKAFNGRIIVEYMADACARADSRTLPGNGRIFGEWLNGEVAQGKRNWPVDAEFGLASTCLPTDVVIMVYRIFDFCFACF